MKIIINSSSMVPIYEQIVDQVKAQIISGELKEDDNLPSVRTLSKELRISALTVKKAYDSLEQEGFSAREIAAILCERMQKKNRRTASLQDVSVRPVPRHADKYSSSHIRGQKYKSRFRSESREKERRNSRRHTADYKRKKSGSRS